MFIALLSISIGFMVYNVVDIIYDNMNTENAKKSGNGNDLKLVKYRNCSISLSMACKFLNINLYIYNKC